ncbi:hypothetical protein KEM56_004654 [Ascosphaera pollenicola]|nr:hypothetical protein KEM56_004654 [Ascosphaera pollenicola]
MTSASAIPDLSCRDISVLQALLDQEPTTRITAPGESLEAKPLSHDDEEIDQNLRGCIRSVQAMKDDELKTAAGSKELQRALEQINAIIEAHPEYAAAYINRAQVVRLMLEYGHLSIAQIRESRGREQQPTDPGGKAKNKNKNIERTTQLNPLYDLSHAISLLRPPHAPEAPTITKSHADSLKAAFTHRGLILLRASDTPPTGNSVNIYLQLLPVEMQDKAPEQLEAMANDSFSNGAYYGDAVARDMAVRTNPYARACGAIVRRALKEERGEGYGS